MIDEDILTMEAHKMHEGRPFADILGGKVATVCSK